MLEYANYLHNNKLAVSLDYDSKNFDSKVATMDIKMEDVSELLDRKQDLDKHALKIKYFVQDAVQMFKEKVLLSLFRLKK